MRQLEYYATELAGHYLLNVQSSMLDYLTTRVVVPLVPLKEINKPIERLNPVFKISGQAVVMRTQFLSAVPISDLNDHRGSLQTYYDDVLLALDLLLSGF